MADLIIDNRTKIIVGLIIAIIAGAGVTIPQLLDEGNWYFCEVENSLKQCDSLSKYGVEDAKCTFEGVGDICTFEGVRMAWKPLSNYNSSLLGKADPIVTALQDCTMIFYNETDGVMQDCQKMSNKTGKLYNTTCYIEEQFQRNYTVCKPIGYMINYSRGMVYKISYDCCGFFNESPYEEYIGQPVISCKEKIAGICNPIIQQTGKDLTIYDEAGRIYVITTEGVKPYLVGSYDYILNNDIDLGKIEKVSQ